MEKSFIIVDKDLQHLIEKLNATHNPILLDVKPEPYSKISECTNNVKQKIEKNGGNMILGWQIWKTKHLVEAEFHAVWKDTDLNLNDITPKSFPVQKIVFVEDENLIYDGRQKDSIRINITNNKLVDNLIEVSEAIFKFDNKGERALLYDLSTALSKSQIQFKIDLLNLKKIIVAILDLDGNLNSICQCNSGKTFNNCHGKNFKSIISQDI